MGCPCQQRQGGGKKSNKRRTKTKGKLYKKRSLSNRNRIRKMKGGGLLGDFQTSVLGTANQLTGSIYIDGNASQQPAGTPYSFGKYLV